MKCSACSAPVRWVVGMDIDGTLARYHRHYVDFVEMYDNHQTGTLPRRWDGVGEFRDLLGLSKKEHHDRKLAFRAGGFKRWMPKFDNVVRMMVGLENLGVEVWVTTTRPWMRMDNVDTDTVEWLKRWSIPYHHLLFDEDKYGRLCELVDPERIVAIVDDEEEQRDRCAALRLPFALRSTEWNHGIRHPGGPQITELTDVVTLVQERIGMRHALQH